MPSLQKLVVRNDQGTQTNTLTPTMVNLLIALLVIVIVGITAIIALFVLRSRRTRQRAIVQQQAERIVSGSEDRPLYSAAPSRAHRHSRHRLTITSTPFGRNSKPVFAMNEKEILMSDEKDSPPTSPQSIPEIRVTFPEEEDESGKRKSGRVVVVKVSELGSVGLEPLREKEGLPKYEEVEGWNELDLEMMGGLKEKIRQ